LAIKRQNKENGWVEGAPEYITPENPAKNLRVLISNYSSAIESVKNVYDINAKYYDEIFLAFWHIYCRIFRDATKKTDNDDVFVIEPVDIDDSGFTLVDEEPEEPTSKGGKSKQQKIAENKSKTVGDLIKLIYKLNESEKISAQHVQEWLKEIGLFFQNINSDNDLTAYLKDNGFSEEDKKNKFHSALTKYCRQLKKRTDITDVERLVLLIKMSEEHLRATYLSSLFNQKDEPDFDYDTTDDNTEAPKPGPINIEDLIAQVEQQFNPTYNELKVKQALIDLLKQQFTIFRGVKFGEFEDIVDIFFRIVEKESIVDLDGLSESIPDNLNKYFFARNNPASLKNIFKSLLLDLEPYLRKICYLKNGKVFGQYEGFVNVAREITEFSYLYNTRNSQLAQFKNYYNIIYEWRNENAHLAPKLPNEEVVGAIYMVLCMYIYATMVSVENLIASDVL
jgi:type I restriction enzyme R subunit